MKNFVGKVVSIAGIKTAIVAVERYRVHPKYEKRMKKTKKYPVHDEIGVKVGDVVEFQQTRPLSATKRWKIVKVLEKAEAEKASKTRRSKK